MAPLRMRVTALGDGRGEQYNKDLPQSQCLFQSQSLETVLL
jgi:hypothetical protein